MEKFKKGDGVEFIEDYAPGGVKKGHRGVVEDVYENLVLVTGVIGRCLEGRLKLTEKTMDNLQVGDILENKGAYCTYTLEVLETLGEVIFTKDSGTQIAKAWTAHELQETGWKLKTEAEIKELTIDEIADKFGLKPEQVHIKKGD